jgi:hypothetical protein
MRRQPRFYLPAEGEGSFDHLVGAGGEGGRPKGLSGLEVNYEPEFGRPQQGQISELGAFEDAAEGGLAAVGSHGTALARQRRKR